jgi:hypothetical protein
MRGRAGGPLTRLRLRLAERRALRLPPVKLCERLDYVGWENADGATLLLLAPVGSPRVARRVLDLFLDGRESMDDASAAARRALDAGLAGVWMVALPEHRERWTVSFLPPVAAAPGDDADALARRCLEALETWTARSRA